MESEIFILTLYYNLVSSSFFYFAMFFKINNNINNISFFVT